MVIMQERDDGSSDSSGGSEKWSASGYNLQIMLTGFLEGLGQGLSE